MMRRVLCLSLMLFTASVAARADEASKRAKVEEMLRITKMDDVVGKVIEQSKGDIAQVMDEQREAMSAVPPAQAKIMTDYQNNLTKLVLSVLKLEDIHPLIAKMYDETYSESELDGILAFYKTPAGQALLTKTPGLMDKVMAVVQDRVTGLEPQIDKLSEQMQKDMAASRGPAASPTPAPAQPPAPVPPAAPKP